MSHTTPQRRYSYNRRSSGYSPITPRSSQGFEHSSPAQNFDGGGGDGGLGNLADELGEMYDDYEEGVEGEFMDESEMPAEDMNGIGMAIDHDGSAGLDNSGHAVNGVRDSGVAMQSSPSESESKSTLSPQLAARLNGRKKHERQRSLYDGSDYGDDSDLEDSEGISKGLERQMAAVESLARRGLEENGSASDQVVKRVVEQLRDLGSQTSIESGATRYASMPFTQHLKTARLTIVAL